jgi:SAM-dependent methyltransferase
LSSTIENRDIATDQLIGQAITGDTPVYGPLLLRISTRYRLRRRRLFAQLIRIARDWQVLDLGCGNSQNAWLHEVSGVVGLDLLDQVDKPYKMFVRADSTALPFADKSFDLVFSNSLLEHLPTWDHQQRCAAEIRRVARRYWVQVPNRHFPIDPHYLIPFFQYLPEPAMKWWARHFSLGWHKKNTYFERVRCLSLREMKTLFPEATIVREKTAGVAKSFIAVLSPGNST